jgi:basic membrane lipoprotein Med (substrate-binding protein (PBP1-ABC) superfamily)
VHPSPTSWTASSPAPTTTTPRRAPKSASSAGTRSRRKAPSRATSTRSTTIGGGAYAALQESAAVDYGIGVDVDWVQTAPQYTDVLLTSILKKIDVSVASAVERAYLRQPAVPVFVSTLANGGVDMGPFNAFDSKVPQALKDGAAALKAKIISGEVKVADYFSAP